MTGSKQHHHPKEMVMGNGTENIVSVFINVCDKFTFINGYLLHPKKDKPLKMLAVTTGFISYTQIKKVDG